MVNVRVRRLVCPALGCRRQTFREQVPGLIERLQRRTTRLTSQVSGWSRSYAAGRLHGSPDRWPCPYRSPPPCGCCGPPLPAHPGRPLPRPPAPAPVRQPGRPRHPPPAIRRTRRPHRLRNRADRFTVPAPDGVTRSCQTSFRHVQRSHRSAQETVPEAARPFHVS
ncbi:hypothetical protein SMALB_7578 [Streptomyces malaysiensis]|uniref:Transposase IS204/IS1001/IS1096/IS1165 zinc-finger domain-containing protein n=1 Tax=Streptomyces malaysiensis TaxID=92644 RepID=A0A7X5XA62_STRMQ|nr:hypothetical protein [Streptomyces malaysiensis]